MSLIQEHRSLIPYTINELRIEAAGRHRQRRATGHRASRASAQAATRRDLPGHRAQPDQSSRVSRSSECSRALEPRRKSVLEHNITPIVPKWSREQN